MMLSEEAPFAGESLPVQALKDYLRLGSGFADDTLQDGVLVSCLRAALAVIEGRTGKAILRRQFRLRLNHWREDRSIGRNRAVAGQPLPLAPVTELVSVAVIDAVGLETMIASSSYRLEPDMERPLLVATVSALPKIAEGGAAEVLFTAGFGDWAAVPADLAQAVLLLAARFYEGRHEEAAAGAALPMVVHALIEPWRKVRVLGAGS